MTGPNERDEIADGFGGYWATCGPGCDLQVVHPGKVQCNRTSARCPDKPSDAPVLLDEIAEVLDPDGYGWAPGDGPSPEEIVAAILASDWLAERDRRTAATALREAADELAPRASSDEPCDNAEDCCGSADSCDAIRPMRRVVGEDWLRDRAERIEADQ